MLIFSWIKLIWIWINRVKYFYVKLDCNKDTRILHTGNKKNSDSAVYVQCPLYSRVGQFFRIQKYSVWLLQNVKKEPTLIKIFFFLMNCFAKIL